MTTRDALLVEIENRAGALRIAQNRLAALMRDQHPDTHAISRARASVADRGKFLGFARQALRRHEKRTA